MCTLVAIGMILGRLSVNPNLHNNVTLETLGNIYVLSLYLPPCCHISLLCIMVFDNKLIHQRIHTTHLYASRCHYRHYCNVDIVLFHNVTQSTNSLLSYIHVNIAYLLNIIFTFVVIGIILGRLECTTMMQHCGQSYTPNLLLI